MKKTVEWIKDNPTLLSLVLIGAVLRLYKLDFQSVWIDEIYSLIQGDPNKSFGQIYETLKADDPHPPLYYFTLHALFKIFGATTWVARLLSALLGIAGMFALYGLAKELCNKKVGLIAVALLCVNWFHIYYSQEARMYSMLFFTTTLSFYLLVRFIKWPTTRNLCWYVLGALPMIYTQFFALFALMAQAVILFYFVVAPYHITRLRFFVYCAIAGTVITICYIPALLILEHAATHTDNSWIAAPTVDYFTQMVKEFFGQSEIVLYFVVLGFILYFLRLHREAQGQGLAINPMLEKRVFSLLLLGVWILITFLVPLICSYLNKPMLIHRYFINTLPALIVMVASGLGTIRNKAVLGIVLAVVLIFSLNDLFVVRDYYRKPTKEQFRELTQEVKKRNVTGDKVVMYWSWLLPYFFKDAPQTSIRPNTLEEYVALLKDGSMPQDAFWYIDGHSRPFALPAPDEAFLNAHFRLTAQIDYLDCWARHYEPLDGGHAQKAPLGLQQFKSATFDQLGNIVLFENATIATRLAVEKGPYDIVLKAVSYPAKPINNENAHLIVKVNGKEAANYFLGTDPEHAVRKIPVNLESDSALFEIVYDNDVFDNGQDRNAILNSISLEKK